MLVLWKHPLVNRTLLYNKAARPPPLYDNKCEASSRPRAHPQRPHRLRDRARASAIVSLIEHFPMARKIAKVDMDLTSRTCDVLSLESCQHRSLPANFMQLDQSQPIQTTTRNQYIIPSRRSSRTIAKDYTSFFSLQLPISLFLWLDSLATPPTGRHENHRYEENDSGAYSGNSFMLPNVNLDMFMREYVV